MPTVDLGISDTVPTPNLGSSEMVATVDSNSGTVPGSEGDLAGCEGIEICPWSGGGPKSEPDPPSERPLK